jgi:hypothetical protein
VPIITHNREQIALYLQGGGCILFRWGFASFWRSTSSQVLSWVAPGPRARRRWAIGPKASGDGDPLEAGVPPGEAGLVWSSDGGT